MEKLIIIGSGPAGLTSAIYTARAGLQPLIIAGLQPGGQLMQTTEVENYPGFEHGIDGPTLMYQMRSQAERFGAKFIDDDATRVDLRATPKKVWIDDNLYESSVIIVATGAKPKLMNVPGESKFFGKGVSSCATCDGAFYRDRVVAIVGGGDSALEEVTFLTRFASKVYLIVRKSEFRASVPLQTRALANPKIEVLWNTEVREVLGETTVSGVKLWNNKSNSESILDLNGVFIAIGHEPVTNIFKDFLELSGGYIIKNQDLPNPNTELLHFHNATSVPGVFVAGDVEDHVYRQAVTAAGEGCKAGLDAEKYLAQHEGK